MATRIYIGRKAPNADILGGLQGVWDADSSGQIPQTDSLNAYLYTLNRTVAFGRGHLASTSKTNGGQIGETIVTFGPGETLPVAPVDILLRKFVTAPLDAQTVSGTLTGLVAMKGTYGLVIGQVGYARVFAYIGVGDTTEVRAVLVDDVSAAAINQDNFAQINNAITNGDAEVGDRIHIEVGMRVTDLNGETSLALALWTGTTNGAGVAQADAALVTDGPSTSVGWLQFSNSLTFAAGPSAPANDAAVDAILIASLPYVAPEIDTTASADTDHAVWYKWVADFTSLDGATAAPVIASTLGSNYRAEVSIFESDASTPLATDYVSGNTYYFRVRGNPTVSQTLDAPSVGGWLRFTVAKRDVPASGDIFVASNFGVHVVRDGAVINVGGTTDQWAGPAIDYTMRTIKDTSEVDNTELRLYASIFGSDLIDIVSMQYPFREINYIFPQDDPAAGDTHWPNQVLFDDAGDFYVGFRGRQTPANTVSDFIAHAITAGTGNIRKYSGIQFSGSNPYDSSPVLANYGVTTELRGSDFIDLAADQTTMAYTSAGRTIYLYDVGGDAQLPDFYTFGAPDPSILRPGLRGLRWLPDGGMLVAVDGVRVARFDSGGNEIQSYTVPDSMRGQTLEKLDIMPDGLSFWVTDLASASIYQIRLSDGAVLDDIDLGIPPDGMCGIAVYLGFRAGTPTYTPVTPSTPPPDITTTCPLTPDAIMGEFYSFQFEATDGEPPLTWEITGGALPEGLTLTSDGLLSGIPTEDGVFSFTITVTDAFDQSDDLSCQLTVLSSQPSVTTPCPLPAAQVGVPYYFQLEATGGTEPYTWTIITGTLPDGLTMSGSGLISGTPTVAGRIQITVQVTSA